ncbi:hypothetical protein CVT26_004904 [Gymnopilus dilepis]|uniref:Uncharacterized protein n=1 Tax=Gymnopilus dilepis TaxID=231916 RepID=A0A409YTC0_9AGAR|nr:hypothetical protein CVT26_004904 [Gymnopilus dilepis]
MKKPGSEKRSFKPAIASKGNSNLDPELADDVTDKTEADKNAGSLGGSNDSSTSAQVQSKTSAGSGRIQVQMEDSDECDCGCAADFGYDSDGAVRHFKMLHLLEDE